MSEEAPKTYRMVGPGGGAEAQIFEIPTMLRRGYKLAREEEQAEVDKALAKLKEFAKGPLKRTVEVTQPEESDVDKNRNDPVDDNGADPEEHAASDPTPVGEEAEE